MSNSFDRIDTDEVRAIMKKVSAISDEVRDLSTSDVKALKNTVATSLKGETADAMKQNLEDLSEDILKIAGGLSAVKKALNAYIKAIEKVDADI